MKSQGISKDRRIDPLGNKTSQWFIQYLWKYFTTEMNKRPNQVIHQRPRATTAVQNQAVANFSPVWTLAFLPRTHPHI